MKVFINPGHAPGGNPDPGAVGPSGLRECDVAFDVASKVIEYLQVAGCEVRALQSDSLEEICETTNAWPADVFVSIHCNSFNETATGMEIWTSRGQTKADRVATLIMNQMAGDFPQLPVRADWSDGDVDKEAGLYVLRNTDCPAVLVELAFISNPVEEELLRSPDMQHKFAAAIARGITDWQLEG